MEAATQKINEVVEKVKDMTVQDATVAAAAPAAPAKAAKAAAPAKPKGEKKAKKAKGGEDAAEGPLEVRLFPQSMAGFSLVLTIGFTLSRLAQPRTGLHCAPSAAV